MRLGAPSFNGAAEAWPTVPQAVDGSPKRFGLIRKALPFVKIAARLGWVWRWPLTITIGPLLVLTAAGLSRAGGAVIVALAIAITLWRSGWFRAQLARAVRASRVVLWEAYWPYLCQLAQFVEIAGRRVRVAGLESIEFGPGNWVRPEWLRFTISPCATHDPATWARYEQRLRRRLRYGTSTWSTPDDDPNVMVITVRRDPLPTEIRLGGQVPADRLTVDPGEVFLGVGADGSDMVWRPGESGRAMLFIAGRQGGGKGVMASSIFAQAIAAGWRVRVVNPKRVGEFRWLGASASVSKTPAGMFAMIHDFRVELDRRADILDETFGVAGWDDVDPEDLADYAMGHRELLLIDEAVSLLAMKGQVPPIAPPPDAPKGSRPIDPYAVMVADLQVISSMGRALGMSLVLMTQHPIAEHMGPFGSTVKANMGARIGVGALEPEGAGALFGKGHGETISQLLRSGIPGRGVYQGLTAADGGGWKLGQALHLTGDDLDHAVPDEPAHLPVTYDQPVQRRDDERTAA